MSDIQSGSGSSGSLPFVYGHVDPTLFPTEQMREAAREALSLHSQMALNYGGELGCEPLRAYLRQKFARDEGLDIKPPELMVTAGASAGLDTALRLFTQPGDTVVVEAPSYHEALAIIRDHPVKLAAVPLDAGGLRINELAERLGFMVSAGERPTLLYTIPTYQNPSGVTLSVERRLALLNLAYRYDLLIIEDDVYRDLYFEEPPPPSLYELDTGGGKVIQLGSFSKILAPGLRLGWAMGPAEQIARMAYCGLGSSGGGANPFAAYVAAAFCLQGWLEPHIARLRENYRGRRDVLLTALETHMPAGVTWTRPGGGFFLWLVLPEPMSSRAVLVEAEERGITFSTGESFYANGGGERRIRLPFSYIERPDLIRGAEILAGIMRKWVDR